MIHGFIAAPLPNQKQNDEMPCAFINSDEKPIEISPLTGLYVVEQHDGRGNISLYGTRTYKYPHPQAPDIAIISVCRVESIKTVRPGNVDFAAIYLLLQAQKVVESMIKVEKVGGLSVG
jgi:hypothetical protein